MKWLLRDSGSWPLAVMPTLIFSALAAVVLWFSPDIADLLLDWVWTEPRGHDTWTTWLLHPLWTLCWWTFLLLSAILGIVASFALSVPLSGPFLELLCERHEESRTGEDAPFSWKMALLNPLVSLCHIGILLLVELVVLIVCLVIGLIPVVGPIFSAVLSGLVSVAVLGQGLLDYPMTLRLWSFAEKLKFAQQCRWEFVGFACCGFVLLYLPGLNLLMLPACVLGANEMVLDWEGQGRIEWKDRRRLSKNLDQLTD
jgi:CysZ protein